MLKYYFLLKYGNLWELMGIKPSFNHSAGAPEVIAPAGTKPLQSVLTFTL